MLVPENATGTTLITVRNVHNNAEIALKSVDVWLDSWFEVCTRLKVNAIHVYIALYRI